MNNSDLVNLLLPISTNYIFGGSRYEPYNTDCSGIVCAAFYQVFGISPYTLGTWTGAQWSNGFLDFIWYGYSPDLPYDDMLPGDVIFTSNCSPDFSTGNGSHVGFYTGNPDAPFLSHFANGGPYVTAVNGVYGNERYYGVKRYSKGAENMLPSDVWEYNYKNTAPKGNMYNCMLGIYENAQPHAFWEYDYKGTAPEGNMYNCILDMYKKIQNLESKIENPTLQQIDYQALAKAVADELQERLKN